MVAVRPRLFTLVLAIAAVAWLIASSAAVAWAVTCVSPWWFAEEIHLQSPPLPDGIILRPRNQQADGRAWIGIANVGPTPLYVVGKSRIVDGTPPETNELALPSGQAPLRKAVDRRAFEWRRDGWRPLDTTSENAWVFIATGDAGWYSPDFVDRNQWHGKRPADVEVPAPQSGRLMLVHGGNTIFVPFTVSYALLPNYEAEDAERARSCMNPTNVNLALGGLILLGLALIGGGVGLGHLLDRLIPRHPA